MKIIKTRFNITKLPAGKVVRQFDIDNIAEKSFIKKFGDKPAYMGYGMEGSGSLAARDYAEKVANRVYFKKLKSELTKTRKVTATGMKSLKSSGTKVSKTGLKIGKARGAMKADIIARTEADTAMDRIMERYTARKAKSFKSAEVKPRFISKEKSQEMGFAGSKKVNYEYNPTEKSFSYVSKAGDIQSFKPKSLEEDLRISKFIRDKKIASQSKVKYKKPKIKIGKSDFQTEFKSYISKEFKL